MAIPFENTNPPQYFVIWAVRNLKNCFSKDALQEAVDKNVQHYQEAGGEEELIELFNSFSNELHSHSHSEMVIHYSGLII